MICVTIGRGRHQSVLTEWKAAAAKGAPLVELRLDLIRREPDLNRILAQRFTPLIITVRRSKEYGQYRGDEDKRRLLLRTAIIAGVDYVDLEMDIAGKVPRYGPTKRIISYHNLETTPAPTELAELHAAMAKLDPDVIKIATRATTPEDNLHMLRLVGGATVPTVGICMGDLGVPSRILNAKFGSPFTFAASGPERILSPGMLSYDEMRNVYHYDEINPDTEVFAVIGDPIAQSLSPLVHNAAFRKLGMNRVYVPFRVPPPNLGGFIKCLRELPIPGVSVTIPHKEPIVRSLDMGDGAVKRTKAANTVVLKQGKLAGFNTDYQAAIDSLEAALGVTASAAGGAAAGDDQDHDPGGPLAGKAVLILGAGGVARACAFALTRRKAIVTISGRTMERAVSLATEAGARAVTWDQRHKEICDILVNCTPIGMHPDIDAIPIHQASLKPGMVVFDTVYTPENTALIKEARERGCVTVTGVDMFVRQATLQFKLFTDTEPPMDLMRTIVKRALTPGLTP